jgi:light-regulated signal transduction histidine kinase (bacteriophytochrome)
MEMKDEGDRMSLEIREERQAESERRGPDQELRRCRHDLEAARGELDALLYAVSHDLGAPLRAVQGFSRILFEKYSDNLDDKGQDYLVRVQAAAQKLNQMVADLLQISRHSRAGMKIADVDLSGIAGSIADRLGRSAPERGVKFIVAENIRAHGDLPLLTLVLKNLLGNAWKFTANKEEAIVEFGFALIDGTETFFVRDNGAGFDMAFSSRLFGAFQRLHQEREFPGAGIGLSMAQRIVNRHGGRIWAEGKVGEGATFYFTLA